MNRRGRLLYLALVAALLLAFRAASEADIRVAEASRPAQPAAAAPAAPAAAPERRFPELAGNLFPAQTWRPPPPPPAKIKPVPPPPPPPPEPPPFTFAYFGRWVEAGKEVVFLKRGEQLLRVKAGDTVNGDWRLDRIDRSGLVFTYLPLNMQRTLRIER